MCCRSSSGTIPHIFNHSYTISAELEIPEAGAEGVIVAEADHLGGGRIEHTVPVRFTGYAGMDIGRDNGMPVDRSYADRSPFPFTGTVKKVVFDINPHLSKEDEQGLHEHAQQALAGHAINA